MSAITRFSLVIVGVICCAMWIDFWSFGGSFSRSPMNWSFTLFVVSWSSSEIIVFAISSIRKSTSCFGLPQFSWEKAYIVRYWTPICVAVLTTCLIESTPYLCPTVRWLPWDSAHRPLPSIMIAMCLGMLFGSISTALDV